MTLIAMAVFDQQGTGRSSITEKVIKQVIMTTNWENHRMVIVDNNSCQETKDILQQYALTFGWIDLITLPENIGTAKAINKAWQLREEGEHCIKMDNDCFIHSNHWIEEMEAIVEGDPTIGMVGLKRKDCKQSPDNIDWPSRLEMLPHQPGHPWKIVEICDDVMGTCVLFGADFLKKFGYLAQPGLYGFDDTLASVRCKMLGYRNGLIPWINIDHLDPPNVLEQDYTQWKFGRADEGWLQFTEMKRQYQEGERSPYEQP